MALKREDLEEFVRNALAWPENTLGVEEGPAFSGAFRMGFAAGDDPIFAEIQADIGPGYLRPEDTVAQGMQKSFRAEQPDIPIRISGW